MAKKLNFKELASDVMKTGKNILDNAIQSADQNDDGKFDMEDVSVIAKSVGNSVKQGYTCYISKENIFSDLLYISNFPCINDNKNLFIRGAYLVKNTYRNITKEEKIQLYLRILESIKFKEDITSEKNSNLRKTKSR